MFNYKSLILLFFSLFHFTQSVNGAIRLPKLFSDHAIFQRQDSIPVWGWANADEQVNILFDKQQISTKADATGRWMVTFPPMEAGGPYDLSFETSNETIKIEDIWVGDVWLCAGQSNMWWPLKKTDDGATFVAQANYPNIRYFDAKANIAKEEKEDLKGGEWLAFHPNTVNDFSAIAFHFAKHLRNYQADIPIGIIEVTVGTTPIEAWTSQAAYPKKHHFEYKKAKQAPSVIFNSMIHPIIPYGIKGVLWYQGENNRVRGTETYGKLFKGMIEDWRKRWNRSLPFIYVQLPNYIDLHYLKDHWAIIREGQEAALELPNTAMVTTIDIGDPVDIHPQNKTEVARRLFLAAQDLVYGEPNIVYSGPKHKGHQLTATQIIIEFDDLAHGLTTKDGSTSVGGFKIAGSDGVFVSATAYLEDDKVIVFSEKVKNPKYIRYAWRNNPWKANLVNDRGFPVGPFRF